MHLRLGALAALLLLTLTLPTAAPQAPTSPPALRIVELLPIPEGDAGQREFIELHNPGNTTIALHGWRIEDAATASGAVNGFTFGNQTLRAGARLVVWSNGSSDARGPSWSTSPSKTVWNDAGDAATLLDPEGRAVDWFAYGNNAAAPPAGLANVTRPSAPVRGLALAFADGDWGHAEPTPALAPGTQGGSGEVDVQNVAPVPSLQAPSSAKAGQALLLALAASDDNGATDLAAWTLRGGGVLLASGNGTPPEQLDVPAPAKAGPWLIELEARDQAGAAGAANATVQVLDTRVRVDLPPSGGVRFPPLSPGQRNVTSLEPFVVRNDGGEPLTALLDVSPFSGAEAAIAVDGNLWVGLASSAQGTPQWFAYDGPLQELPVLGPGEAWSVWLRLDAVPSPLPAGSYGTSFAVVAA